MSAKSRMKRVEMNAVSDSDCYSGVGLEKMQSMCQLIS